LEALPNHPLVTRHTIEPDRHTISATPLEKVEVILNSCMAVECLYVDVPGDRLREGFGSAWDVLGWIFAGLVLRLLRIRMGFGEFVEHGFVRG
jgi:hypothetical protein